MTRSNRRSYMGRFLALVLVALIAVVGAGCGPKADAVQTAADGKSSTVMVTAAPSIRADITKTVDVNGSLKALQDVVVGAKLAGRLVSVYVHEGDAVTTGQVVAVMDVADFQAQLRQAQANLDVAMTKRDQANAALAQAQTSLQSAETSLAMAKKSTAVGLTSAQKSLDTAKERLTVVLQGARAQERQQAVDAVASAKANYERAKSDLQRAQKLAREQAISQSSLDSALATFDAAQASFSSAQQNLSLVREGARPEERRQAELAVQIAQDAVSRAESDRDQVRLREQDLRNAQSNITVAKSGVKAAASGVVQAQAAMKIAKDALDNAYVRSPITGYVAQRIAEPGQQLGAAGSVMRIVSPKSVYLQAVVSESQFADVQLGQKATVTVDSLPGRKFEGTVTRMLPVASAASRSFTIRVDFEANDQRLRSEMFARGSILIDTHRNATLVPKDAVLFDPATNRNRVFVVGADSKVRERIIELGYVDPERVEVRSGVRLGEKVVVAGQTVLQNGDTVKQ